MVCRREVIPSIIYHTSAASLFSCFQLDIEHPFFLKEQFKIGCHVISCKINVVFLHKSMGIIESGMGGMTYLLQIIILLFYITKSS